MKPKLSLILSIAVIKRYAFMVVALLQISGCQTLPDPDIVRQAMCDQLQILSYSQHDTEETAIAITNHNLILEKLCP